MNTDWTKTICILLVFIFVCILCKCCDKEEEKTDTTEYVPVQVNDEIIYFPKVR